MLVRRRELSLAQIFFGGQDWYRNLDLARALINMRGGPAVLLARSELSKSGSVTGVSRARLLLEIIAVYELFGTYISLPYWSTTESRPENRVPRQLPTADLIVNARLVVSKSYIQSFKYTRQTCSRLMKANSGDSQSYVEKVFGMSREFVPLLARVSCHTKVRKATSLMIHTGHIILGACSW